MELELKAPEKGGRPASEEAGGGPATVNVRPLLECLEGIQEKQRKEVERQRRIAIEIQNPDERKVKDLCDKLTEGKVYLLHGGGTGER